MRSVHKVRWALVSKNCLVRDDHGEPMLFDKKKTAEFVCNLRRRAETVQKVRVTITPTTERAK